MSTPWTPAQISTSIACSTITILSVVGVCVILFTPEPTPQERRADATYRLELDACIKADILNRPECEFKARLRAY
jgi:hypothetical protein